MPTKPTGNPKGRPRKPPDVARNLMIAVSPGVVRDAREALSTLGVTGLRSAMDRETALAGLSDGEVMERAARLAVSLVRHQSRLMTMEDRDALRSEAARDVLDKVQVIFRGNARFGMDGSGGVVVESTDEWIATAQGEPPRHVRTTKVKLKRGVKG